MNPTEIRLQAAEEYIRKVKQAMDGACVNAYVFGSVARNEAKKSSDLDLMLVLQRPTKKERFFWNSFEELNKRGGLYNFAKNSHEIFSIAKELENKYGFIISIYIHYENAEKEDLISYAVVIHFKRLFLEQSPTKKLCSKKTIDLIFSLASLPA